jgi:hypothetical protein
MALTIPTTLHHPAPYEGYTTWQRFQDTLTNVVSIIALAGTMPGERGTALTLHYLDYLREELNTLFATPEFEQLLKEAIEVIDNT